MDVTKITKRKLRTLAKGAVIELGIEDSYKLGYFDHTDSKNIYMGAKRNRAKIDNQILGLKRYPLSDVKEIWVYYF